MVLGMQGWIGLVLEGLGGLRIYAGEILGMDVLGWLVGGGGRDQFAGHRGVAKVGRGGIVLADAMMSVGLGLDL